MKRIVICADGTWNVRDQLDETTGKRRPTNVTKIARAVKTKDKAGINQVVYYHDGVGTGGPLDKVAGGVFGEGIDQNIRELYRFIVYNFVEGDQLFLFGFSRGAYTVRTLVGFMDLVGLVGKDDDYYVPDMYDCYEKQTGEGTPEWARAFHNVHTRTPCPPIAFVGVWDTVGSLGAPGVRDKESYHQVGLRKSIQLAFHALAIDERRVPFAPTLWTRPEGWGGTLEQVWFAGAHCGVGGGYTPDGLANCALHWLVARASDAGLEFDQAYLAYFEAHHDSQLQDSMTRPYRMLGENLRPIGLHIGDGESIHQSAIDRWNSDATYRPPNLQEYLSAGGWNRPFAQTKSGGG